MILPYLRALLAGEWVSRSQPAIGNARSVEASLDTAGLTRA